MKINVCNVDEEGRFGGPERRIVLVAKALKQHNIDTHVVYPKCDSDKFSQELSRAGISSSALNITRLSKEKKILARYVFCFFIEIFRLFIFFRRHNFDLIHVNGSYQFKVALAGRLAGIPVIWHLNDTKMDMIVKKICLFISKYCASGFIVTGKKVYEYYIRGTSLEKKPHFEIQVPVETTVFDPSHATPDKRVSQAHGRKIVTVSGINPIKGLEFFIKMASNLARYHSDLVFFVAGAEFSSQKTYYEYIKDLVASSNLTDKNFKFVGMIDNVPAFLQSADIFVFTSVSESGPATVWEAMSMGKAIVSTDVGSVSEYIEDGVSGFIAPIRDVGALCEKVEFLLENPDLRQKMGEKARIIAQKNLDVSLAAQKHAYFYRKILSLRFQ
ncbi:glycosyltransferase family 4 protein [Desulfonema magnum]|uniref:Glycosyltransferase domain-containing protein n=1 Tax=Desulfonema magnum TaxID=45655 RepID=A0A975BXL3_9BACT|nr:glycosyltransferase family 4 protein [Desulfonema magnum]QTA93601.1 Glycosyltransferase domain-containing protein [Desulfonema magnum]